MTTHSVHHLKVISRLGSKRIICQDRRGILCSIERSCDRVVTSLTKLVEQLDVACEAHGAAGLETERKFSDVFAKHVAVKAVVWNVLLHILQLLKC